jgi:AraC family transcriptional regulator of adaptative response / DNA-3-methyladenine glycosylase II
LGLDDAFPTAQSILALGDEAPDVLGSLGVIGRRSQTIIQLATLFQDPDFFLSLESPEETIRQLLEIPGIGPWTAHALAMRVMKWPDAFPGTDYGVKKALEPMNPKEIERLAEQWRPWRAYAVTNLWGTL